MRPRTFSYSPVTADLVGFLSNATGATWTLTNTATTDGLGHAVTVKNDSVTDHSAKTAVLTGTDAQGNAQTETINLPAGSATVTSSKFFKTLTSIVPSATIGADTMDIGWAAPAVGPAYPVGYPDITGGGISISVVITGTINYGIQHTLEDVFSSTTAAQTVNWLDHASLASKTASADGSYTYPVRAIRFKTTSVTNGATVSVTFIQGNR